MKRYRYKLKYTGGLKGEREVYISLEDIQRITKIINENPTGTCTGLFLFLDREYIPKK